MAANLSHLFVPLGSCFFWGGLVGVGGSVCLTVSEKVWMEVEKGSKEKWVGLVAFRFFVFFVSFFLGGYLMTSHGYDHVCLLVLLCPSFVPSPPRSPPYHPLLLPSLEQQGAVYL